MTTSLFETTEDKCPRHGREVFCRLVGAVTPHVCTLCALEHLQKHLDNATQKEQTK